MVSKRLFRLASRATHFVRQVLTFVCRGPIPYCPSVSPFCRMVIFLLARFLFVFRPFGPTDRGTSVPAVGHYQSRCLVRVPFFCLCVNK
jgi:hypothetical protein